MLLCGIIAVNCWSDTIYLKNGTISKGIVVEENIESIILEQGSRWQKIYWAEIEMIEKEGKSTDNSNKANTEKPSSQMITPKKDDGKGKILLMTGIIMMLAGGYLIYDGSIEKVDKQWAVDISNPGINVSSWEWTSEKLVSYWANPKGKVVNTGNVTLRNVKMYFYAKNSSKQIIASTYCYLDNYLNLPVGYMDTWSTTVSCGAVDPVWGSISYTYDYDPIYAHYKTYKKNQDEINSGYACALAGIVVLLKYYVSKTKAEQRVRNNRINVIAQYNKLALAYSF